MAVEAPVRTPLMELERELARMANAQFDSDAFRRLLSTKVNIARGKILGGGCVTLHEAFPFGIGQIAAFPA